MLSRDLIQSLRERIRPVRQRFAGDFFPSSSPLDRLLPDNGFRRGTLVEWLGTSGSGVTTLATIAAREALRDGGALVVVDSARHFYPPAAVGMGIDLERLIIVRPSSAREENWVINQALSCPAIDAVLCWPSKLDDRMFRRWQLAAENGGSVGLLVRPVEVRGNPTWTDVQLLVEAQPGHDKRRLQLEVLRCRSGRAGQSLELEIDEEGAIHEATPMRVVTGLASATSVSRSARS